MLEGAGTGPKTGLETEKLKPTKTQRVPAQRGSGLSQIVKNELSANAQSEEQARARKLQEENARLEKELQKLIEHNKKYMVRPEPQPAASESVMEERETKPPKMKRIGGGFMPKDHSSRSKQRANQ